jgi:hypothetical protein
MGQGIQSYTTSLGQYWLHEGILHFQASNAQRTLSRIHDNFDIIKKAVNYRKVCLLADLSDIAPVDKPERDYMIREIQETYKAVALVSDSAMGNLVAKMFLTLKEPNFPAMKFDSEKEATVWLMQFRDPAY